MLGKITAQFKLLATLILPTTPCSQADAITIFNSAELQSCVGEVFYQFLKFYSFNYVRLKVKNCLNILWIRC